MNTTATLEIATALNLDTDKLDRIAKGKNCPGFRLWEVLIDGNRHLMAGDDEGAVYTRLCFRGYSNIYREATVTLIGDNPDVTEWERIAYAK